MTFDEIVDAVKPAVPTANTADAEKVARAHVQKAIRKIGRLDDVDFNRKWETFSFTAGKSEYVLGVDILDGYDIFHLSRLWDTGTSRNAIEILGVDEFKNDTEGLSSTGWPLLGTVHSDNATLEVYPVPDSTYTVGTYIKKKIASLDDIDDAYHDIVIDLAVESIQALGNPNLAMKLVAHGIKDLQASSRVKWGGNRILVERHVGGVTSLGPDSQNLSGE